jgi:predicted Zn-dependent protease
MRPKHLLTWALLLAALPAASAQRSRRNPAAAPARSAQTQPESAAASTLSTVLQRELDRAMRELAGRDPAPYFISYSVSDRQDAMITAGQRALFNSMQPRLRIADISVRVASPALDNTHNEARNSGLRTVLLPLDDDPDAIARVLWQATDQEYKAAARAYLQVKTNTAVRAQEEDASADFSKEQPEVHPAVAKPAPAAVPDFAAWEARVKRLSAVLARFPNVYNSSVQFESSDRARYFVSTDGARITTRRSTARLIAYGETRADDGMELVRNETWDASTPGQLPADDVIVAKLEKLGSDLEKLRGAPVVEPFTGPALLSGRSAAVFFHEVLGHRVEGQRQRGVNEGQTFTKKINQQVLPAFLSVSDDPTLRSLSGVELAGAYDFDDEGVASRRVPVVENGVLKEFLMSRMPVKNFEHSNGHGRAQEGRMPVGRQGNLVVSSSHTAPNSELRQMLIAEVKRQGKPYGLYFEDIAGGFTLTTRTLPQAFQVLPLLVWRVYPDGRSDELVRGVDIVGTPLTAMTRIIATGDKTEVFNGVCGAESGSVPVSAAAPAMLFSEIEVQKRRQTQERPPLLPPPNVPTKMAAGEKVQP